MIFKFSIINLHFQSMDMLFKQIYLHLNIALLRVAIIIIKVVSENCAKSFLLKLHLFIFYDHLLQIVVFFNLFALAQSFQFLLLIVIVLFNLEVLHLNISNFCVLFSIKFRQVVDSEVFFL